MFFNLLLCLLCRKDLRGSLPAYSKLFRKV